MTLLLEEDTATESGVAYSQSTAFLPERVVEIEADPARISPDEAKKFQQEAQQFLSALIADGRYVELARDSVIEAAGKLGYPVSPQLAELLDTHDNWHEAFTAAAAEMSGGSDPSMGGGAIIIIAVAIVFLTPGTANEHGGSVIMAANDDSDGRL